MTNAIIVQVGRKSVNMVLVAEYEVGQASAKQMQADGWQVWTGAAKRPNGGKHHLVYRSARTNQYVSVATI